MCVIVVRKLEVDLDLILLTHILSPEILKIKSELPIEILNFLFQYPAGGLLKKGILQSSYCQEVNGCFITFGTLVGPYNILQVDAVGEKRTEIFKQSTPYLLESQDQASSCCRPSMRTVRQVQSSR